VLFQEACGIEVAASTGQKDKDFEVFAISWPKDRRRFKPQAASRKPQAAVSTPYPLPQVTRG
jgi:hypothetical protein